MISHLKKKKKEEGDGDYDNWAGTLGAAGL